jgi:hypothetical protein
MNFEHLLQINDPENPLLEPLSRQQLWNGLLQRVEHPLPFLPGLEACTILGRQNDSLQRELNFGSAVIRDHVTFSELNWVRFAIVPNEQHAGGCLTITIEEPGEGFLYLCFAYETTLAKNPNSEERAYIEYVKSAYHQSDVDCVRIIRRWVAEGSTQ